MGFTLTLMWLIISWSVSAIIVTSAYYILQFFTLFIIFNLAAPLSISLVYCYLQFPIFLLVGYFWLLPIIHIQTFVGPPLSHNIVVVLSFSNSKNMEYEEKEESCVSCGSKDGFYPSDGFYYCVSCNIQVEGLMETCVVMEDTIVLGNRRFPNQNRGATTHKLNASYKLKMPPITFLYQSESDTPPTSIKLTAEHIYSEIRMRYVMGIQLMIQSQCEVLMECFGASPMIVDLASIIWLRFVAFTRIFDPNWADETVSYSELNENCRKGISEKEVCLYQDGSSKEYLNMHGQSLAKIWLKSLKSSIPLSYSLAICFLSCHMAREAILPTDIYKWSLEGELPYLTAFVNIEKHLPPTSCACPFSSSVMFKPSDVLESREIEVQSAFIAHCIGLELPPVNFFAIARRYLKQLSLPFENILPLAVCVFEWSMPPDIWLSTNSHRLPTRVCVMSIILFTLRILCNINGFGHWEASLSTREKTKTQIGRSSSSHSCGMKSEVSKGMLHVPDSDVNSEELLSKLEAVCDTNHDIHEYSKDLSTYLEYCRSVVFVGIDSMREEEWIVEKLWKFYEDPEDAEAVGCVRAMMERNPRNKGLDADKARDYTFSKTTDNGGSHRSKKCGQDEDEDHMCSRIGEYDNLEKIALKRLKLNMLDDGFHYIPPRVKVKKNDYLHYIRKNDGGSRSNVAHADYYILLRACAKVAQVGVKDMHAGALELEKRLSLIENLIDQSFCYRSQTSFCYNSY